MTTPRKAIFAIVPLAILLLPIAIYLADRATSSEEIARNVFIADVPVGGLNVADATIAVEAHENALRSSSGVFTVNGEVFKVSPLTLGLDVDGAPAVSAAFAARRDGGPLDNFVSWLRSFSTPVHIPLTVQLDEEAVDAELDAWERFAVPNPAFDGSVEVIDGEIVTQYPSTGHAIDRAQAHEIVLDEMSTLDKTSPALPVVVSEPKLSAADVDAAAKTMAMMIDDHITLRSNEVSFRVTFTEDQLASAVRAVPVEDGTALDVVFDEDTVLAILEPRKSEYEIQPVDARFDINLETDEFTIIPGRNGTVLDVEGLLTEMKTAALGPGIGGFPVLVGAEPAFTTEDAQAFTTLGPLGGFTTEYPPRQPRVTNIHQMADDVDGAIVLPGEVFSINERVGERTEEGGYVAAPAIINGVPYCCDHPANIGGGVSQFGTTLFNAVFFSCLEDVEHRPHSLYFSRYPMGREATLGVPGPDVKFRNNTEFPVIVTTAYTDTSVTVKMYGDNGGLTCDSVTSDKEDVVAFEQEFVADETGELEPGERTKERSGIDGFLVHVERIVTEPDGSQRTDLELVWRYRPLSELWTVHPCEVTGEPVDCPVQVANVTGKTWDEALALLAEQGLLAAKATETVDDPTLDNIVTAQVPPAGEWLDPGSTVTLTVGLFSEG